MLNRYIYFLYAKHFLIIFLSIDIFYTLIDFLFSSINLSANMTLLYLFFVSIYGFKIAIPFGLIFGTISSLVYMIKSNNLVILHSFGYSKKDILKPFLIFSTIITSIYIVISGTDVAYFYDNANAIKKNEYNTNRTTNLFIRNGNQFIYIQSLYTNSADGVNIFEFENSKLKKITYSKSAKYDGKAWELYDVKESKIESYKIVSTDIKSIKTLHGFKPKVIDLVSEHKRYLSFIDAFDAIKVFHNINLDRVFASIYITIFVPFFAPIAIIIIFFNIKIHQRLFDIRLFSSITIFSTISLWGILYILQNIATSKNGNAEVVILLPMSILFIIGLYIYKKI